MNKMEDTDTSLSIYLLTLYHLNTIQSPLGPVKLRRFIKIELSSVISLLNTNLPRDQFLYSFGNANWFLIVQYDLLNFSVDSW